MKNLITYSRLARICGVHRMTVFEAAKSGKLVDASLGGKIELEHPATQNYIVDHMGPKTGGRRKGEMPEGFTMDTPPPAAFGRPRGPERAAGTDGEQTDPGEGPGPARAMTKEALAAWMKEAGPKPRAWKLARDFGIAAAVARAILSDVAAGGGDGDARPDGGVEAEGSTGSPRVIPSRGDSVDKFLDMTLRELRHSFGLPESMLTWLEIRRKAEDLRGRETTNNERLGSLIPREMVRIHLFGALEQLAQRLLTDTPQTLARRIYALARSGSDAVEAQALAAEIIGTQIKNTKQILKDNFDRIKND